MEDKNNNNIEIQILYSGGGAFPCLSVKRKEIRDFDLNEYPIIDTDTSSVSSSSPVNTMLPNSQDSADNCKMGMGGVVDFQPAAPVQPPLGFSFPPEGQATKDSEQVPSYNDVHLVNFANLNANNVEMPMSSSKEACAKVDGGLVWKTIPSGVKDANRSSYWQGRPSSSVTDFSYLMSTNKAKYLLSSGVEVAPDMCFAHASHGVDGDGATEGSKSPEEVDAVVDEHEANRRETQSFQVENDSPSIRQPRIVIQTESEDYVPDDGFGWKKYGEKKVKGNPNPRSYYKCTYKGCAVKKLVERAPHDPRYVICTYDGKHNHGLAEPPKRKRMRRLSGNVLPSAANAPAVLTSPGIASIPQPEAQVQPHAARFDGMPGFANEFLRPSLVGNFSNNMNYGSSSTSQMKYVSLNNSNTMPYGSPYNYFTTPQAGPSASRFSNFPTSAPQYLPSSGDSSRPNGSWPVFLFGQQLKENATGFA